MCFRLITFSGTDKLQLEAGIEFVEPGVSAQDVLDGDLTSKITVSGSVNPKQLGKQQVIYSVTDKAGNRATLVRIVDVVDTTAPQIHAPTEIVVAAENANGLAASHERILEILEAIRAHDVLDGTDIEISKSVPEHFGLGENNVKIIARDKSFNSSSATLKILVKDQGKPQLNLVGEKVIRILKGHDYQESGVQALDDIEGDISAKVSIEGVVNINQAGTYRLIYSVTDAAGNAASVVSREIVVYEDEIPPVISGGRNMLVEATSPRGVASSDSRLQEMVATVLARDDVDGDIELSITLPDFLPIGANSLTFTATDSSGNETTLTITIEIVTTDRDFDGITDEAELNAGLDPDDPADAVLDKDGDGHSNLQEHKQGSNLLLDDVAPVLTIPDNKVVNSTGPLTPVDLGLAMAIDIKDGTIIPSVDNSGPFSPGRHFLNWAAEDSAGNIIRAQQVLEIVPMASFSISQAVNEGSEATVDVMLNGSAASYPVTISFTIGGTADHQKDHDLINNEVVIESGTRASFTVSTTEDQIWEGKETIELTMHNLTNAIPGARSSHSIKILEENMAPDVTITMSQNGIPVTTIAADGGAVELKAIVDDLNPDDHHSFEWNQISDDLAPNEGYNSQTFTFDPAQYAEGLLSPYIRVVDDGEGNLTGSASNLIRIVTNAPVLSGSVDSDNDGVVDSDEGAGDTDMDRIPDYLDPVIESHQIPSGDDRAVIQTDIGLSLILGETAFAAGNHYASVSEDDLRSYGGEGGTVTETSVDEEYQYTAGVFDFEVVGLEKGASVHVVIPQNQAIPADAVYRKFFTGVGWSAFVEYEHNSIRSSAGSKGVCPAPGDSSYEPGLIEGYFCVQLEIEDGGPNDTDGEINGVVKDPGGVAVKSIPAPVVSVRRLPIEETLFSSGAGEKVVFGFVISSDSTDAELRNITLGSEGDLNEVDDIGSVRAYRDANGNGVPESAERVGEGAYSTDNGDVVITLIEPYQLPVGGTSFLITYHY